MKKHLFHVATISLASVVLLLTFSAASFAAEAEEKTTQGTLVSAAGDKIVIKDAAGKDHTFTAAEKCTVTVDGKAAAVKDLKPGMKVTLTVKDKECLKIAAKSAL